MTVEIIICTTCLANNVKVGDAFYHAFAKEAQGRDDIRLRPVECLSVCKRPCTVAVTQPGKWTYLIGDLQEQDMQALLDYAAVYAESEHGTPPLSKRPIAIKRGTIARIPPLGA